MSRDYRVISDSEDDDEESMAGFTAEPILEPIDPYSSRPLPFRIGTPAFFNEDNVVQGEYASDEGTVGVVSDCIVGVVTEYIVGAIVVWRVLCISILFSLQMQLVDCMILTRRQKQRKKTRDGK